jgi:hypothetical protein
MNSGRASRDYACGIKEGDVIDTVDSLPNLFGFIHYQLLRFSQDTRLQYINSCIILPNRCVLQQQHVDCKIVDALLKRGTKQHVSKLITQYDWKEVCAQSQSQVNEGTGSGSSSQSQVNIGAGPRPSSQDGVSQLQDPVPLSLPQFNRLVEASYVRDENSVSNADVTDIPSQFKVLNRSCFIGSPSGTLRLNTWDRVSRNS